MEKSSSIINISKALVKFRVKCPVIPKKSRNPWFKSTYAAFPDIQDIVDPVLSDIGLIYSQHPEPNDQLTTLLIHADSGEFFQSTIDINPVYEYKEEKDANKQVVWRSEKPYITPQTMGSAITYAKRYALCAILGLKVDDDDDGNAGSGKATTDEPAQQSTPDKPILEPSNKKLWQHQILSIQNKRWTADDVKKNFNITSVDFEELSKLSRKAKETLKPGNEKWNDAIKYLATGKEVADIIWKYNITDANLQDLKADVEIYKADNKK